jgi:coenzyme F420-reducing hydrogenase delta subunit
VKYHLEQVGLEPERVQMFNMSAAMAGAFVAAAQEMSERIAALGPNPLRLASTEAGDQENPS